MSEWDVREGETPIDLSDLRDRSLGSSRTQLYDAEAANIIKAFLKYDTGKPIGGRNAFTYGWLLDVHRDMFCDVWTWAGQIRKIDLLIGIRWQGVGQALSELLSDVTAWDTNEALVLERVARLHHRAVQIHPFENGNGRWARFIANIWLRRIGKPRIEWPDRDFSIGSRDVRATYLDAIRQADEFNYRPLIELQQHFWPG